MKVKIFIAMLLASVLVAAFSIVSASAAIFAVNVGPSGNNFSPTPLTITQGDTVNWNWVSGLHNVTSGSCPSGVCSSNSTFNSGAPTSSSGVNFSFMFNTPGSFPYFCSVHGSAMQGTITVNARAAEVPEADSLMLVLSGGAGLLSYLGLKWRSQKRRG